MMTFDSDQRLGLDATGQRKGQGRLPTIDATLLLVRGMYIGTTLLALSAALADFH
jgi:hypothetical protein